MTDSQPRDDRDTKTFRKLTKLQEKEIYKYNTMESEKEIAKSVLPEVAKGSMQLVSQFYQDLAQPTVQTIGKTLNTTFEFATIPALAMQFATEKVKANFAKRLDEYKKKWIRYRKKSDV